MSGAAANLPAPAPPRLVLDGLRIARGARPLLAAVTLVATAGMVVRVAGPNGTGKTSLLRALVGLAQVTSGRIGWGEPPERVSAADLSRMALFLPAAAPLRPGLTVDRQLGQWLGLEAALAEPGVALAPFRTAPPKAAPPSAAAPSAAALSAAALSAAPLRTAPSEAVAGDRATLRHRVGLGALGGVPVERLSTGQGRRLMLALLLASTRPLWLLDEPGSGLDLAGRDLLADLLLAHRVRGGITLLVAHDALPIEPDLTLDLGRHLHRPSDPVP